MPYVIRMDGPKDRPHCLYLRDTGKKIGCHKTHADAEAQRAAIEIAKHKRGNK